MRPQTLLKAIGRKLRLAREQHGFTQEDLARIVKIHRKTIAYIENGKRDFGVVKLTRICRALGLSPTEIFDLPQSSRRTRVAVK